MNYLAEAQSAWANARHSEDQLRRGTLTSGQREFAEAFVPRAKQDAATLAQLAQAEALTRIADTSETQDAELQSRQPVGSIGRPPDQI